MLLKRLYTSLLNLRVIKSWTLSSSFSVFCLVKDSFNSVISKGRLNSGPDRSKCDNLLGATTMLCSLEKIKRRRVATFLYVTGIKDGVSCKSEIWKRNEFKTHLSLANKICLRQGCYIP